MTTINSYMIVKKISQGKSSYKYKIQLKSDSQMYFLKKFSIKPLPRQWQQQFEKKIKLLISLKLPNHIQIKGSFIKEDHLFVVQRFMENGNLSQKIKAHIKNKTKFDEKDIWKVLIKVLKVFKELHHFKLHYKDFQPKYVLFDKFNDAKLDYLALWSQQEYHLDSSIMIVPYYSSPEIWKDQKRGEKCDIWSLGCVIYEVATLQKPFRGNNLQQLYRSIVKGKYPKIQQNYSGHLSNIIDCMLQVKPSKRPNAQALLAIVQETIEKLGINISQPSIKQNDEIMSNETRNKIIKFQDNVLGKQKENINKAPQGLVEINKKTHKKSKGIQINRVQQIKKNKIVQNYSFPQIDKFIGLKIFGKQQIRHQKYKIKKIQLPKLD